MLRHLLNAAPDRQIVVPRGHNQVSPDDRPFFIDLIVMDQDASRRLDHAHALEGIYAGGSPDVSIEDTRLRQ